MIFHEIFDNIPLAMILVNREGDIVQLNAYTESLFQYSAQELVGSKVEILLPESKRDSHPALLRNFFEKPIQRKMGEGRSLFGQKKDGVLFPLEIGLNPIFHGGDIYVLGIINDISEKVKAEVRFKAAVEAAPHGMVMIDQNRKIIFINQKIEDIFGYYRHELIGNTIEVLVPEDFKSAHPKLVDNYLKNPESRAMGIGRDLYGRHKNGKLIPVEIGLQPIQLADEMLVISSIVDISARKKIEQELKRKTDELAEFSYRTSHDLRAPLKSIIGMSDCIEESIDEGSLDQVKVYNKKISILANKLNGLIESIMMLTKVDFAEEPRSNFNFAIYSEDLFLKNDLMIKENKIEIEFNFNHTKELNTQEIRLTQILDNIITNAIKYYDPKKEKHFVKVKTFSTSEQFMINIEDNGMGIPLIKHSEVFTMFKRFHENNINGTGLGLYLVKKQIDQLHGKISFESSSDGTVFYIVLPINIK